MGNCCNGEATNHEEFNMRSKLNEKVNYAPIRSNWDDLYDDREILGLRGSDKIAILIKIQAIFRGVITRRRMKKMHCFNAKTCDKVNDRNFDRQPNYQNQKV